ncbi:unnamed protein product [Rhizopus stolonifer]
MSARGPNDLLSHKTTKTAIHKKTNKPTKLKESFKLTKEQQDLMTACLDNDLFAVSDLLEKHQHSLDPDRVRDSKLRTPLLVASAKGNTEIVKELIKWGADVNNPVGDIVGNKPLHLAVISNNFDTVLTLLEAGAKTRPDSNQAFDVNQLRAPLSLATSRLDMLMNQATNSKSRSLDQVMKIINLLKHYSSDNDNNGLDELTNKISSLDIDSVENEDILNSLRQVIENMRIS